MTAEATETVQTPAYPSEDAVEDAAEAIRYALAVRPLTGEVLTGRLADGGVDGEAAKVAMKQLLCRGEVIREKVVGAGGAAACYSLVILDPFAGEDEDAEATGPVAEPLLPNLPPVTRAGSSIGAALGAGSGASLEEILLDIDAIKIHAARARGLPIPPPVPRIRARILAEREAAKAQEKASQAQILARRTAAREEARRMARENAAATQEAAETAETPETAGEVAA